MAEENAKLSPAPVEWRSGAVIQLGDRDGRGIYLPFWVILLSLAYLLINGVFAPESWTLILVLVGFLAFLYAGMKFGFLAHLSQAVTCIASVKATADGIAIVSWHSQHLEALWEALHEKLDWSDFATATCVESFDSDHATQFQTVIEFSRDTRVGRQIELTQPSQRHAQALADAMLQLQASALSGSAHSGSQHFADP